MAARAGAAIVCAMTAAQTFLCVLIFLAGVAAGAVGARLTGPHDLRECLLETRGLPDQIARLSARLCLDRFPDQRP